MTTAERPVGLVLHLGVGMAVGTLLVFVLGVLAPFLVDDLGLSATQIGALPSAFFLAAAITSPRAGAITDRIGPRRSLLLLDLLVVTALILLAVAQDVTLAVAAALVAGVGTALSNPATNRVVADEVPPGIRGIALGVKQAGVPAGSVLAGALLPSVAEAWGWRSAVLAAVSLPLLDVALAVSASRAGAAGPPPRPRRTVERFVADLGVRRVRTFAFLMGGASGLINTFLVLYASEELGFSRTTAGLVAAAMGVMAVGFRVGWAHLGERHVPPQAILVTIGVAGTLASLLAGASRWWGGWSAWVAALLAGSSIIAFHGVMNLLILQLRPAGDVGRASGFVLRGFFLGLLVTPVVFGATIDAAGHFLWVWAGQAILCVAATTTVARWTTAGRPTPAPSSLGAA